MTHFDATTAAAIVATPDFAVAELARLLGDATTAVTRLEAAAATVEAAADLPAEIVEIPEGIAPLPAPSTRPVLVDENGFEYDMSIDDTAREIWDADGIEADTTQDDDHEAWAEAVADETAEVAPAPVAPVPPTTRRAGFDVDPESFLIFDDTDNTLF